MIIKYSQLLCFATTVCGRRDECVVVVGLEREKERERELIKPSAKSSRASALCALMLFSLRETDPGEVAREAGQKAGP